MEPGVHRDMFRETVSGIAATVFVFALCTYIPLLSVASLIFVPLPTLVCRSNFGRRAGMIVPAVSAIIMTMIIGSPSVNLLIFAELLLLGFMLGELFEKRLSIDRTVLCTCGTVLGTGFLALVLHAGLSGQETGKMVSDYMAENLELTLAIYKNSGVGEADIQVLDSLREQIHHVTAVLPAMVTSLILFIIWTVLLVARPLFRVRGLAYPDFGRLVLWKPPDILVWPAIGCSFMLMLPISGLRIPSLNILMVLMTVYLLAGIAIVAFYLEKKQFPLVVRALIYTVIAIQVVALVLVSGIGFFDIWLDTRKLEINKSEE